MKKGNNWLIISYFSNVDTSAQANWIDDRIIYIKRKDIQVTLISSFCGGLNKNTSHYRVPSITPGSIKYELGFILKRFGLNGNLLRFVESMVFLPLYPLYFLEVKLLKIYGESRWDWALPAAIIGYLICVIKRISVVYSTGGPVGAHIAAGWISKIMGIRWIAELQDPLVGKNIGRNRLSAKVLGYCERFIFRNATKVVFCTQTAKDQAEERYPYGKSAFIYPGASLKTLQPSKLEPDSKETKLFKVIHIGSLYQTRNLSYFLEGLHRAISERSDIKTYLRLLLFGAICSPDVNKQIDAFPYPIIEHRGLVKRDQALFNARISDVLLLIQNTDGRSTTTIPSKIYEYLLLHKPVLALTYNNEELNCILKSHGHIVVQADNPEQIKEAIVMFYDKWNSDQLERIEFKVSEYTVERAVSRLLQIATSV